MSTISSRDIFDDPDITPFNIFAHQATAVQWMRWIENKLTDGVSEHTDATERQDILEYESAKPIGGNFMRGGVLADDMGLGKTKTMASLFEANLVPTTLVIAPLNIIPQLAKEFLLTCKRLTVFKVDDHQFFSLYKLKEIDGVEVAVATKLQEHLGQGLVFPSIVLINRDKLISPDVKDLIHRYNWFRIVIDEAHIFRNGDNTSFYRHLQEIPQLHQEINGKIYRIGSRFAVTGTPIQNDEMDLVNLFRWIDDRTFTEKVEEEELRFYIKRNLFRRNRDQITSKMKQIMGFPEHPPEIRTIPITLKETPLSKQMQIMRYPEVEVRMKTDVNFRIAVQNDEKAFIIGLTAQTAHFASSTNTLNLYRILLSEPFKDVLCGFEYLGSDYTKIQEVDRIVQSRSGESFIIFHQYNPIREVLKQYLAEYYPEYIQREISGDNRNMKSRDITLMECNRMISEGKPVLLFSSIKATSEGLNYQAFNNMIIVDQDPNPQQEFQAMTRIYRIGQRKQTRIWFMAMESFSNAYGRVHVDERLTDIKNNKTPKIDIIEKHNAAWYFRRYTFINMDGVRESGVYFDEDFERMPKGVEWGDSVGPPEIH